MKPLESASFFDRKDLQPIFSNIKDIVHVHERMLEDFERAYQRKAKQWDFGSVFLKFVSHSTVAVESDKLSSLTF